MLPGCGACCGCPYAPCSSEEAHTAAGSQAPPNVSSTAASHPHISDLQIGATYSALALYLIVLWSIYPIA